MKKYQVIGGQYEQQWYGESDTICGAKRIATNHMEFWDNRQGWRKPDIYTADHVKVIKSEGRITTPDGKKIRIATGQPICTWNHWMERWV